jgi:hypothetical protein
MTPQLPVFTGVLLVLRAGAVFERAADYSWIIRGPSGQNDSKLQMINE